MHDSQKQECVLTHTWTELTNGCKFRGEGIEQRIWKDFHRENVPSKAFNVLKKRLEERKSWDNFTSLEGLLCVRETERFWGLHCDPRNMMKKVWFPLVEKPAPCFQFPISIPLHFELLRQNGVCGLLDTGNTLAVIRCTIDLKCSRMQFLYRGEDSARL